MTAVMLSIHAVVPSGNATTTHDNDDANNNCSVEFILYSHDRQH